MFAQKARLDRLIDSTNRLIRKAKGQELLLLKIENAGYRAYADSAAARREILYLLNEAGTKGYEDASLLAYRFLLIHDFGQRKKEMAFAYGRKYISKAFETGKLKEAGDIMVLMAKFFIEINQLDSATVLLNEAEQVFRNLGNKSGIAEAVDRKGLIQIIKGNYRAGNELYYAALEELTNVDNNYLNGVINYHLGFSYFHTGDYELAAMYIHRAYSLWEPFGPDIGIAQKWNSLELLGNIYLKLNNLPQALANHRMALAVRRITWRGVIEDRYNLSYAYSYNNIAECHRLQKNYDSAYYYGEKSLRIKLRAPTNASGKDIGNSYIMMSKLLKDTGKTMNAVTYADSAIFYYEKDGFKDGLAEAFLLKSKLIRGERGEEAFALISLAFEIAKETDSKNLKRDVYFEKAFILEQLNRNKEAIQAFKLYIELNNEILSGEIVARVTEQHIKHETEKKNQQIAQLNLLNERNKRMNIIFTWAFLISVSLVILLFVFVRLYRKNASNKEKALNALAEVSKLKEEKFQRDLEMKNLELKRMIDSIKNKNTMLDTIKSVMLEEIRNNCKAPVEVFNRTVKSIQSHVLNDFDWEVINKQIEELESSFATKLRQAHPSLTGNDIRLCSYFKINLSTKEIASLMNISEEAVRKQRYRLRKKMGFEDESIEDYLLKL